MERLILKKLIDDELTEMINRGRLMKLGIMKLIESKD